MTVTCGLTVRDHDDIWGPHAYNGVLNYFYHVNTLRNNVLTSIDLTLHSIRVI